MGHSIAWGYSSRAWRPRCGHAQGDDIVDAVAIFALRDGGDVRHIGGRNGRDLVGTVPSTTGELNAQSRGFV
jgi:hypothetical protein